MLHPTTTPVGILMFAAILWLGPVRGLWVFFASMALRSAAAVTLPGLGDFSLTDFCVFAIWTSFLGRQIGFSKLLATVRLKSPGLPLILLMVLAAVGAVFLPRIFTGHTDFFVLSRADGRAVYVLAPLQPTNSNIGQLVRMVFSVSTYVFLAAAFAYWGNTKQALRAMILSTAVHAAVSLVDLGSHAAGLPNLLDGLRTMNYAMLDDQRLMNIRRLVGGFPEPSSFAFFTVGLYGFWLKYWFGDRKSRLRSLMLFLAAALLLRSLSTSGIVTFVAFTGLFLLWHVRSAAREQGVAGLYLGLTMAIPMALGAIVLIYNFVPAVPAMLDTLIFDKMASDSGEERMSWNVQALRNFVDSYGIGIGIGSVRASSWLMTNLGSFGILGTALQAWFLLSLAGMARKARGIESPRIEVANALLAGCMTVVLYALIARPYPNLDTPFYAMAGVAVGLYTYQRYHRGAKTVAATAFRSRWTPRGRRLG